MEADYASGMRIQNHSATPSLNARRPAPSARAEDCGCSDRFDRGVTIKDLQLMREVEKQERIIRMSHALPWVTAAASGVAAYMATQHLLGPGLGAPLGLVIGAGVAEWISFIANQKLESAEAQLGLRQS